MTIRTHKSEAYKIKILLPPWLPRGKAGAVWADGRAAGQASRRRRRTGTRPRYRRGRVASGPGAWPGRHHRGKACGLAVGWAPGSRRRRGWTGARPGRRCRGRTGANDRKSSEIAALVAGGAGVWGGGHGSRGGWSGRARWPEQQGKPG
jgi:hypothetical protein